MMFEIMISEQADADLRAIYEYIAFELQSPQNAAGQFGRLEAGIMSLSQMPERFREYENKQWRNRGLRIMPVDNYCVFYVPDEQNAIVTVIRVMYGGRDMNTQLKRYTRR